MDESAPAALRAVLERRCAQGVASAAAELVGDQPELVCQVYAAWHEQARRPWPWLAGLCFDALEQLGVGFPQENEDSIVAGRVLIAVERDPERVRAVLRVWRADPDATGPLVPGDGDLSAQLRQRSLLSAVDQFWEELGRIAARLHPLVLGRDRDAADAILRAGRRPLEDNADHLRVLAGRLRDEPARTAELAAVPSVPTAPSVPSVRSASLAQPDAEPSAIPPASSRLQPAPPTRRGPSGARAAAPSKTRSSPTPPRPSSDRRPSDEGWMPSSRPSGEHRLAPILFLGAVTIGALIWIVSIGAGALSTP